MVTFTDAEIVDDQPQALTSLFSQHPKAAIKEMEDLLDVVASKCTGPQFIAEIKNKKYPRVEWWTTVGSPLGLFPRCVLSERLERENEICYLARVDVHRNGQVITSAEAICSSKEYIWSRRDEYAIKSMAITRATGKAYRIGLSFLAVMAGLQPTNAEEISPEEVAQYGQEHHLDNWTPESKARSGKYIGKRWCDFPDDYLVYLSSRKGSKQEKADKTLEYLRSMEKPDDGWSRIDTMADLKSTYDKLSDLQQIEFKKLVREKIGEHKISELPNSTLKKLHEDIKTYEFKQ